MNLICCDNCSVVLNKSRLSFPSGPCVDGVTHGWCDDAKDYLPFVSCPVCKAKIFKRTEQ